MAINKRLTDTMSVKRLLKNQSVIVKKGSELKRITLSDFIDSIQSENLQLRQYAWGISLASGSKAVGNLDMWESFKEQMGCYLLTSDGTKAIKLSKSDRTKFIDGTDIDKSIGHIMFHAPRLYYTVTDGPYLWMSQYPIGSEFIEESWIGCYKAGVDNNKLVSKSEQEPVLDSISNLFNKTSGEFGICSYDHRRLMTMLYLSEFGISSVKTSIGNSISESTGQTASLGDNCGSLNNHVSLFGLEDPWGNGWEVVQGIKVMNNSLTIYNGNDLEPKDNSDKRSIEFLKESGYINSIQTYIPIEDNDANIPTFDILAKTLGEDSNSGWFDWYSYSSDGVWTSWGGDSADNAGINSCKMINPSINCATRLAFYGKPKIITNKNNIL